MDHVIEYQAQCSCGWRSDPRPVAKEAQVEALRHEAQKIRRSYAHDADTVEIIK
jgi:hypothetical protein